MYQKIPSHLISALIGGVVSAVVVLLVTGHFSLEQAVHAQNKREPSNGKFKKLEVEELVITNRAVLRDSEGKDKVVIKEGSILADDVVLGKKFIGTQYQGHVFVANRMFTTPDDLVATPMDQWRFFTEIGSDNVFGGEVIVRSADGANTVGKQIDSGLQLRAGFDESKQPQFFVRDNSNGNVSNVPQVQKK
jgi:hypothetical protein